MFNHGREDKCFWEDVSNRDTYRPSALEAMKQKYGGAESG